ncbi:Transcription factor kayak [Nesidiocoris tenuis]|uniref:Transcription factor kayak n=1 Tax=Nesidiocoris tenuis TaxID=355587 RepID=A0ABN7A6D3_9HEMI|nr:Transcription factor kayak [Nesidiocoris tenuis]
MASRFSGAIQIANLDDFITPSQECIKPVEIQKEKPRTGSKIRIEEDGSYVNVSGDKVEKLVRVDITLADCLACSGCITTAETVLVTQQSHEEMLRIFRNKEAENKKLIVVSIAVQTVVSIAQAVNLAPETCLGKLTGLFRRLGADMVLDIGLAEDLALIEEFKEFTARYKRFVNGDKSALPMLASTCPGWVCYTEKTKSHLLPNLSSCRSPQQIMGRLVKSHFSDRASPSEIYHVTLMPCYDKKLEASRTQFTISDVRDVDCVVTPVEIVSLIKEVSGECGLASEDESDLDWPWEFLEKYQPLTRPAGSGSGGYAQHILAEFSKEMGIDEIPPFSNVNRRVDMQMAHLQTLELKIAVVTGFRNIQNLVNKMKRGTCDYHYVEVMACPTGCLNGGAQVKGQLKEVEGAYNDLPVRNVGDLLQFYNKWFGDVNSPEVEQQLHTTFEAVTYNPNPLGIKW